jgi:hypothetical protein
MDLRPIAVAAAFVATWAAPRLVAQSDAEYLQLVDRYIRGESGEAAAALASWPESAVRSAARSLESQLSPTRLRTAVMLHTESAFNEVNDGPESYHLDLARSSLRRLLDSARSNPAAKDFAARWHALTAMLYCTRQDARRARIEVNRGLSLDADHKYVNLVANAVLEYEANFYKALHVAAQGYRVIVANHPDFFEARLRLGSVLIRNDSLQNAREQLEIVATRATSTDVLYLAHMFLASLHERAHRADDAEREYEAARAVAPYPSSLIALIRIATMRGQVEPVRSLAAEIPMMAAAGQEDPWSYYRLCVTGGDLYEGLKADAQRP